eukprot:CAMPEP_0204287414 /NCGR_PEP_ID=MMETSP0468-20130131/54690_1 /ASSEMBLY_ACC=CAM_ASM_000383 /TAXON_ID=2969 /ORGANISM="Oxyrrhis marina" /LENGTH=46 /DNA_ID= /DNA_START= /DNA_END= /DNA_ORIENTATION=
MTTRQRFIVTAKPPELRALRQLAWQNHWSTHLASAAASASASASAS